MMSGHTTPFDIFPVAFISNEVGLTGNPQYKFLYFLTSNSDSICCVGCVIPQKI
jgi:hypothetical protein